ncbi:uncharacterized protein LOC142784947 isoform X1 [Rhipicephalus microplus]|uniref:uncharacterized protein LOC142784947 isoform X1 n=1 Tax=Rhipicephalus microplus TaxID=6941 RepID=UPI003F6C706F
MLISSFLVVQVLLCFYCHGFFTSMATNAPVKRNNPTRTAIRTTSEQQAWPTIENDTCPERSFYVTGTITPSCQGNGLGYISTARTQEPFSGLGGTDQRTMLIPSFLVVQEDVEQDEEAQVLALHQWDQPALPGTRRRG